MEFIWLLWLVFLGWIAFLIWQGWQRRQRRQEMLNNLKTGDEVLAAGGLIGQIAQIRGNRVMLDCGQNIRLWVLKQSVVPLEQAWQEHDESPEERAA